MSGMGTFQVAVFALFLAGGSVLVPQGIEAGDVTWLFRIKALLTYHHEMAEPQGIGNTYTPYFEQVDYVQRLLVGGERTMALKAMHSLMNMLQFDMDKGGGIPLWSAKDLYAFCGETIPPHSLDTWRQKDVRICRLDICSTA